MTKWISLCFILLISASTVVAELDYELFYGKLHDKKKHGGIVKRIFCSSSHGNGSSGPRSSPEVIISPMECFDGYLRFFVPTSIKDKSEYSIVIFIEIERQGLDKKVAFSMTYTDLDKLPLRLKDDQGEGYELVIEKNPKNKGH